MEEKRTNIVLIGMPGVGKSTAGVILAKIAGFQFIDADLLIQKEEGKLLRDIIREQGTDGFLKTEGRINSQIQAEYSVIATGGSVVYEKEAMEHLREIGQIVYLHVSFPVLEQRLKDIRGRGVVLRDGQTLKDLYEERTPLYESYADITIDEGNLTVEDTVEQILEKISVKNFDR